MMRSHFHTRLQRLEQHAQAQEQGVLHLWRLPEESEPEALARCAIDPADFPEIRVHVWIGARISARLARPPQPCWIAQISPGTLEHRGHAAATMLQRTQQVNAHLRQVRRQAAEAGEERP